MNTKFIVLILISSCLVMQSAEMVVDASKVNEINEVVYDRLMNRKSRMILLAEIDEENASMICNCGQEVPDKVFVIGRVSFVGDSGYLMQSCQLFNPEKVFNKLNIVQNSRFELLEQEETFEFMAMLDQHRMIVKEFEMRKKLEEHERLKRSLEVRVCNLLRISILVNSLAVQNVNRYKRLSNPAKFKPT